MTNTLYDKVLEITRFYFGPAAERHLNRQIGGHLKIKPEELAHYHLDELAKWSRISGMLYLKNEDVAEEYKQKVLGLKIGHR